MKRVSIILLFLLSLNLAAQTDINKKIVYTTESGSKYHKGSCHYLKKSKNETTLSKAKVNGYEPCKVCKPYGTVYTKNVKSSSSGRCTATTQKGTRCKRNSASGSNRCWQH